jgi:hypothetical protein
MGFYKEQNAWIILAVSCDHHSEAPPVHRSSRCQSAILLRGRAWQAVKDLFGNRISSVMTVSE